jgi:hypothetical protein
LVIRTDKVLRPSFYNQINSVDSFQTHPPPQSLPLKPGFIITDSNTPAALYLSPFLLHPHPPLSLQLHLPLTRSLHLSDFPLLTLPLTTKNININVTRYQLPAHKPAISIIPPSEKKYMSQKTHY